MRLVKKTAALSGPVVDLMEALFRALAELPKAAVLTHSVFKHNRDTKQELSGAAAKEALAALRSVRRVVTPLRSACALVKVATLTAAVAAPKLISVMDASVHGLGLIDTAIGELIMAVEDMSRGPINERDVKVVGFVEEKATGTVRGGIAAGEKDGSKLSKVVAWKTMQLMASRLPSSTSSSTSTVPLTASPPTALSKTTGPCCNNTAQMNDMMDMLQQILDRNHKDTTQQIDRLKDQVKKTEDNIKDAVSDQIDTVRGDIRANAKKYSLSVSEEVGNKRMRERRDEFRQRVVEGGELECPEDFEMGVRQGEERETETERETESKRKERRVNGYSSTTHCVLIHMASSSPPPDGPPHKPSHCRAQTTNIPEDGKASQAEPCGTCLIDVIVLSS